MATTEQTAADRLAELTQRRVELEERFSTARDRKIELRELASEKIAAGGDPNGERKEIRDLDSDLDLLAGAMDRIGQDIEAARRDAQAERSAEIAARAEAVGEEAKIVAEEAAAALRELVTKAKKLEEMSTTYANAVNQAKTIARRAGVEKPAMTDDIHNVAWPATPDHWTLGYYWHQYVEPAIPDFEHMATAISGADYFNAKGDS